MPALRRRPRCAREWPQVRRRTGPSGEPCPPPDCPAAAHSRVTAGRREGDAPRGAAHTRGESGRGRAGCAAESWETGILATSTGAIAGFQIFRFSECQAATALPRPHRYCERKR